MDDRTFLSQVKGFTPVIDVLTKELGMTTALVYGIAWRYCQMNDRVCRASKETIGKHAKISSKTVQRHLHRLVEKGYLEDTTPDWKHKPHIYKDAGKVQIYGLVEARLVGGTESPTSEQGRSESPARWDRESQQGRTESPTKKETHETLEENLLPIALDGHQRAVDRASGTGQVDEPEIQIAEHLYWGFMEGPVPFPDNKRERERWKQAAKRLLFKLPRPWDIQAICQTIDEWFVSDIDDFWKENPQTDKALDRLAKYIVNPSNKDKTPDWVQEDWEPIEELDCITS